PTGPGLIVIVDGASADAGAIFQKHPGGVQYCAPIRGAGHLVRASRVVARALGLASESAIDALAELGTADPQEWAGAFDRSLRRDADGDGVILFDEGALRAVLDRAAADSPGALTTVDHPHREVQRRRHALAAGLIDRQTELVAAIAGMPSTPIGFGGSFF